MYIAPAMTSNNKPSIGVIGYGSQGRALALNFRDSGYEITVGLRQDGSSATLAGEDGFNPQPIPDSVRSCEIVVFSFPDHAHHKVYHESIASHLAGGKALLFLHGTSIHFKFIEPPDDVDIMMLAPHAPGAAVREKYLAERDLSAFWAVEHDASGSARETLFQLAEAAGFARSRLIESTFARESVGDLFGEQAVLCGGLSGLIKNGYDTLVQNGLPPDHAYLEVCYQIDLIVSLIKQHGIRGMFDRISVAAQSGSVEASQLLFDQSFRDKLDQLYRRITDGSFPEKLKNLSESDLESLKKKTSALYDDQFEAAARRFSPNSD
jgi:ketol-acid reductoisomerase